MNWCQFPIKLNGIHWTYKLVNPSIYFMNVLLRLSLGFYNRILKKRETVCLEILVEQRMENQHCTKRALCFQPLKKLWWKLSGHIILNGCIIGKRCVLFVVLSPSHPHSLFALMPLLLFTEKMSSQHSLHLGANQLLRQAEAGSRWPTRNMLFSM